jgi:ubiquinone/menaquinone biosynthesis C-methylase UbiE/uncharacterized protein YbaR (Trm112 family)
VNLTLEDVKTLACPCCHESLTYFGHAPDGVLDDGYLECDDCERSWSVRDGLPRLVDEAALSGLDRFMRIAYDWFAPLHDTAVEVLIPILQGPSERPAISRAKYMARLKLSDLGAPENGGPVRILEVGVGGGANLPLIEKDLPDGLDVELWGLDLSEGMLRQCQRWLARRSGGLGMRLLAADAHALPFSDQSFDRVFHVGAINGYGDPRRALAEMARVARPDTPIVVVDEQLDPSRRNTLYHKAVFWALTAYNSDAGSPAALLPDGAKIIADEQISRLFYSLTFSMPPRAAARRRGADSA